MLKPAGYRREKICKRSCTGFSCLYITEHFKDKLLLKNLPPPTKKLMISLELDNTLE